MGADPRETTVLWERMYAGMRVRGHRGGFYLEALSGVDIALWDIAGQAAGEPIWRMLGGSFRNPVRVYASGLPALAAEASDEAFDELIEEALQLKREGFTGLKVAIGRGIQGDLQTMRTLRDRLGADFLLYADAAGVYDRAQALRVGRGLEELGVEWFEMPIFPEDVEGYAQLAQSLDIRIALDSVSGRHEVVELIRNSAIDVVQPDVCRAGGITECRRIADLADAFGLAFAPHVSIGSAIHFAATAHLATAMPNTLTSEYWIGDNPLGNNVLEEPLVLDQGYLRTPDGPGLGIRIIPAKLLAETAG
jgi:D-arabinonate dehydratase/D-galactarolactone cycloisomerase